jgi:hypothetical protein
MNYWLDLFTGETWQQFHDAGCGVSGFNKRSAKLASQVKPGDVFLCYLTGVMRWVGALKAIGPSTNQDPIWGAGNFPIRFDVETLVKLSPEHGVPMDNLKGKVRFYKSEKDKGKFKGFVRQSLKKFEGGDGSFVLELIKTADQHPVFLPVDPKKLAKKPFFQVKLKAGDKSVSTIISVPEAEEAAKAISSESPDEVSEHTSIQFELLTLGAAMGFDVWVAKNDRKKKANGTLLGSMPRMLNELPAQFNVPAQKIIELIDVLWLEKKTIVAAFEIEHTTSIYSGLLRMSDLLALVPNLNIKLYIVAPDERREKVETEVLRPTFSVLSTPLKEVCRYISFEILKKKAAVVQEHDLAGALKPDFLDSFSEEIGAAVAASA